MGVRMGIESTYFTQGAPSNERLSKDEMRSGVLMALANTTRSREARSLATAYAAWKQVQETGTDTSMQAFVKTFGNKPLNNTTLMDSTHASLRQRFGQGSSDAQIALAATQLSESELVRNIQETENLGSVLLGNKVDALKNNRREALSSFYRKNRRGLRGVKDEADFIKQLTNGNISTRSDVLIDRLSRMVSDSKEGLGVLTRGTEMFKGFGHTELLTLGTATVAQAQEYMYKFDEGKKLQNQKLYYDRLNDNVRRIIKQAINNPKGVEGLIAAAHRGEEGLQIKAAIAAWTGTDVNSLNKLTDKELQGALDKLQTVGPGRGSPLSGIRKLGEGVVESATVAVKKDKEYALLRTNATAAITKLAKGESLSDSDKAAIDKWMSATTLTDTEQGVYKQVRNGSVYVAQQLVEGDKSRESLFNEHQKLREIGKSYLGKEYTEARGAQFVSVISESRRKMAEARKKYGSSVVDKINNMDSATRASVRGEDAKALKDIEAIEAGISKLGIADSKSLLSMVQESGGSVQSFLSSIVGLLTTIANKK
jgi:hypothetical protein